MSKKKKVKHRNLANPELAKAMQELRRSNAATRHVLKKFRDTRTESTRKAISDQC